MDWAIEQVWSSCCRNAQQCVRTMLNEQKRPAMSGYTRRQIIAGLGALAGRPQAVSQRPVLSRERAVAILEAT
jgi:hypothetical protein